FDPVATTSPSGPFDSSRALKMNRFEYVNPESGVTPALVAFIPVGYTPRICASAADDHETATLIRIASRQRRRTRNCRTRPAITVRPSHPDGRPRVAAGHLACEPAASAPRTRQS